MRLCYAFLPPLKQAPMISMTTKTIRYYTTFILWE